MNKLYVIGIGPGDYNSMTVKAHKALECCDVIIGYTVYTDLIRKYFPDKDYYMTPMLGEVDRCRKAIEYAESGKSIAVICSGDAGIYGMASLIYELAEGKSVDIEVIAGVSAASSGAALLGAPISHDFAVISFSDLLTPIETIEKRVECAAMSDMVIVIYNPSSKKRSDYMSYMCDIMLRYKRSDTVCGVARNIGREGETYEIMTLLELKNCKADMFSTVFIGSDSTKIINNKMVTPRGYNK